MTDGSETKQLEVEGNESHVTNRQQAVTWGTDGRFRPLMSVSDRLWSQVHMDPVTGCWLWTGCLNKDLYGVLTVTLEPGVYRTVRAHCLAWELLVGPIRKGLTLDHLIPPDGPCTSRACVNPAHLEMVTRAENARRARRRERLLIGAT